MSEQLPDSVVTSPADRYQIIPAGMHQSTVLPSMDFETYSEAGFTIDEATGKVRGVGPQGKGGLPVVGTPVYAEHPSTEILCLYYNLKDGKGTRGWIPCTPGPVDLIEHIRAGLPIEAHNVTFEFWIWNMVCVRRYGWPVLTMPQCYCAMAKARRHSLPGALGGLAKVLGTKNKDPDGNRLINKLCRPVSATKNRKQPRWTPATAWEDFTKLYSYCGQDVDAEDAAAALVPDLTDYERKTWMADQTINARGVLVDVVALDACLVLMRSMTEQYTLELCNLTAGAVGSASEVAKLTDWLKNTQGLFLPDMTADTVREFLGGDSLTPQARRALEIRSILAGANIKKLPALKLQLSSDGRLRNQYMYCGADRTGRWSAGGVQLQNITSKGPKSKTCDHCGRYMGKAATECPSCWGTQFTACSDWTVEAVETALQDIQTSDLDMVTKIWGDPSTLLAGCLRGLFIAKENHRFICCDFSAIEAVAAACLARCQWRIDVFNTHGKIYEMSASKITGTPLEVYQQYKIDNGFDHPDRKKIGKIAELASGYGGWINAWKNFGADMDDGEIKRQVLAWREASPEIVEMWGGQFRQIGAKPWDAVPELYGLEGMAILAILNPGKCYNYIDITYGVHNDVLYCRLPSGRFLSYHRPKLINDIDKLNRGPCYKITFEGYNSNAAKGRVGWNVLETYGGRLFENVVQAVAADIQGEALVRLEERSYPVVMHTHDEGISEVGYGRGSVDEMAAIMSERPAWASWWPLRAAGWEHKRYQKD